MNKLYIAATPIGNINQASYELISVFKQIKYIFCEDTRVSKKLFSLLNIDISNKIFISNHNYNEKQKIIEFEKIIKDNDVLLISDAGYPLISDPGYNIVNYCITNNIFIHVINGPCAIVHSIIKSGFNLSTFMFLGFLDTNKNTQINYLYSIKNIATVFVIYESVHKIYNTLKNINEVFANNNICVCKELTKIHETYWYGKPNDIIQQLNSENLKGEFVIIIDNTNINNIDKNKIKDNIINKIIFLKNNGLNNKTILIFLMLDYPDLKNMIYKLILDIDNEK